MRFSYFCKILHHDHGVHDPKFIRHHKKDGLHYVRIQTENRKIDCDKIVLTIQENIRHTNTKLNIIYCCSNQDQNYYIATKLQNIFGANYLFANITHKMSHIGSSKGGIMLIPFHLDINELVQTLKDYQFQNNVIGSRIEL